MAFVQCSVDCTAIHRQGSDCGLGKLVSRREGGVACNCKHNYVVPQLVLVLVPQLVSRGGRCCMQLQAQPL